MRYRTYFPPGYPHEERARAALEANAAATTTGVVSFRISDQPEPDGGYKLANLIRKEYTCPACHGRWWVWAPHYTSVYSPVFHAAVTTMERLAVDPGKCPACSPVAAELEPEKRARLFVELVAVNTAVIAAILEAHPDVIASLTVACDAAQNSRAVAEYRSPRDIARIAELETALETAGLLV